ncbi:MAG: xanthine dehydrogenase family protein subunit M [Deltaproteobacteria bacterium]|nr:xanthine dehydrogenase family protein subunit M [Deltaproteobacteria bacterium]
MQSLKPFEYVEPATIEEAVSLLSDYADKGKLLAGGVDIMPRLRHRKIKPAFILNIKKIQGLDYIDGNGGDGLRFGALTTIRSIELSPVIRKDYSILYEAAHQLPSHQVKSMGTMVGNLCVGTPASDMATSLLALDAELKIVNTSGEKILPIEDFYIGVGQTVLEPGDMVTEVILPSVMPGTRGSYQHLVRTRADISKVCVAVWITITDGICKQARIALGAVAPTVFRAKKAEALLNGRELDQDVIEAASQAASQETKPITDLRSTAEYRKEAAGILVKRALNKTLERAKA